MHLLRTDVDHLLKKLKSQRIENLSAILLKGINTTYKS